jgi:kynurenine formamidase
VDDNLKVTGDYTPTGVNNWGRWGDDDQLGTLNFITDEQVRHATTLPKSGQRFNLGLPISNEAPRHPTRAPAKHYFSVTGSDKVTDMPLWLNNFAYVDDSFDMATHGTTHFDALGHVVIEHTMYNGFWAGAVSTSGAEVLAIGEMRRGFVGRGVLVDVARHLDVEWLDPNMQLEPELIDEVCAAQNLEIRSGDIVLFRTGALKRWWTLDSDEDRVGWFAASPGPGITSVEWFHEHEISAGAADNYSFEAIPGATPDTQSFPLHRPLIVDLGFTIGELWVLDELAAACAEDGQYDFLLVAQPLYLPRAVGSPLNPIAIK